MSNSIFNLDPTTHQASLSKVNIGASDDASLIVLGKVTKVYYHQGTLDFKLTSGVSSIVSDGSGNGTGSARIPLDYFGQDSEGRTYGHYRPVQIGDTVAIAYLNGHKTSPIVIGVYAPNGEQYEAISPTLFDSGDDKDNYIAETGLAEQHVHHSGQISYRSGSGRLFESLNGYSFMVIDDDTSQDYSELYTDLSLVPYSSIDGKTHDPQREKAGDWLLVHEDNPNGLDADNHITRFYVNKAGDFELVFTNTSFAGVSTVLHMDKNGMQLNKYIGHQRKKAGLPRASEEDQTYTADFDSAPTTVTFDLGKTKDDTISLKSSTTVDSKEQATNLEVRTDGVYINDVKLFDSNSNSLAALNMFLDGGVMDFSKITVKNFSGDNIEDGTIDGTKLKDKTVTADKLNISKLSDISSDMGIITSGSIQLNNGTQGSTGVSVVGDPSSDPDILTASDKAHLQQQLNALYSQCQALIDYGTTVGIDISELKTNEQSLKDLTDWIFETDGNVTVDRPKIDDAITNFMALLETYRNKFTSQLNQKVAETSNKANSIYQGSQAPDQANTKEGDLWLQTNSDGTSNIMQYTNGVWQEANLKGYQDAITAAEKAQDAADKLPHNYYQATEPSGTQYNDGDLWYQSVSSTSDGKTKYNVYKWDISSKKWVQFIDNHANASYVASSAPADPIDGDFWTDTDGTLKQYQNGSWKTIPTQGPQGVPGVNAKQQYIHIAYATSANGAENFSTTTFNGATYIGLLVDENEVDSTDYTKYTWSLMKGDDGTDGKDGVPGKPGSDGQTSYVHFAYANSEDGKTNFNVDYFDNALYIGIYTDFNESDSSDPTKYTWSRLKGKDGQDGTDGKDGVPGVPGVDGKTSYIHTAYANSADGKTNFNSTYFSNALYIGIYTDFTESDSSDPTKYTWSRLKGQDGADGIDGVPGPKGADGQTSYVHFAYANSADGKTNFNSTYFTNALYIGTYTDFTETDSSDPTKYTWSRLKGDTGAKGDPGEDGAPGPKGADGVSTYVWIKYSTSESGEPMSDSPVGMSYLGLATGKTSPNESSIPTDYKWTKIKGEQGVAGTPGADGKTPYVHIAYANSADGKTDFTTNGNLASQATLNNTPYQYTGTYVDYNQTSSNDPSAYVWTLIYDKSKKRNFTTTPTTPYNVGDTWTQSGATYFCTNDKTTGAFNASDWQMQQLTIHSLDDDLQANINGTKNLLMVDDIIYYSNPALDSTNTYNEGYPFDYTSTDNTYTFQVQAKSTVSGDYVHMYPAWGNKYSQSQDKTIKVDVTTSPSVPNQITTFNSVDSNTQLLLTTDWVTYTCTVSGTWDKGSVLTALLGRVFNSETKGTVSFRKVKLVAGNAIKDYTSDDSITVAQGSNYWDLTTLQQNSASMNLVAGTDQAYTMGYGIPNTVWQDSYAYLKLPSNTTLNGEILPQDPHTFFYNLTPGQEYTQTVWLETDATVKDLSVAQITWWTGGASHDIQSATLINLGENKYKLYSTYRWPGKSDNNVRLFDTFNLGNAFDLSTGTYLKFGKLKLEQGTISTDWSPNPSDSSYASWSQNRYYTPWYPISEGQRVFLTHYDYPAYPGIPNSASVEFADSNHNFISNGTNNSQGSSSLNGSNSSFISPQSLGGVYYNERMLKISIASEAWTSGTYQDLYIQTSGLLQSKLAFPGRGTTVATFDPYSGKRVDTQYWDTFASVDNANALVNYLNSIANQDLVVAIATQDSFIQDSNDFQIASQNLCTVLQSMGLPSSYAPADLRGRVSFAFVGHTKAYQGTTDKALVSSSKGDNQVSTLTAYVSNGHISSANNTGLVNQNALAKTTNIGDNLVSGTAEDIVVDDTANTGTQGWNFYTIPINANLKVGDKITVSVENVTITGKGDLSQWGATLYSKDISEMRANNYAVNAGNNAQVTITVTSMNNPNKQTALLIYSGRVSDTEGKKAVFHHLKVEHGSIATPWSPNPSDSGYASWLQTQHQGPLVAYANAPAKTAYFRAGYSFSTDEINRVHFMVTVDKLSTNYSSSIADVSSNAVRKDVSYRGVTLNDNGLTATAGDTQVIVNSSNGFEIKKKDDQTNTLSNVFSVDTNGNVYITGSTISKGNISAVDFQGDNLTLSGTLDVTGSIVAANKTFTIDQNGMKVSPQGGGSVVLSKGGLTIQGSSVGSLAPLSTYGNDESLPIDPGLFATKDSTGATKTWISSSGTLIAQDAVIHGNISVHNLNLADKDSEIVFGSGFKIDGNGTMTSTSEKAQISNGTYSDGVIEGSELDIGTAYHSKLSDADKYRYNVSNIGETTFGMSQDLGIMSLTPYINQSYLSVNSSWTQGQVNFRGSGHAPNNADQVLKSTGDIFMDTNFWKHRFSAPVNGVSDIYNAISIWDKSLSGNIPSYSIGYQITDDITRALNTQVPSWGGSNTPNWTLGTVEFPSFGGSLFKGSALDLYPALNQTITLKAGEPYVFGAYIWHCGLHGGAKVTIELSTSDSVAQNSSWVHGNVVSYQQNGYSICTYTPSSDILLRRIYVEAGTTGPEQGYDYGVPLSITDPFAVSLNQFTSKLFGGGLDTLTSLGGRFGMPYPHLDGSQHGVLGLVRADNLTAGDRVVVSIPINHESVTIVENFPQINLGLAKPGNDDIYIPIDGEFQPLMPGYYTYDFYFVWKDEYKEYINNNLVQLNLISKGMHYGEKAYVVSVDSVRMGIFVGKPTTSSTYFVNEYQTKFSPLGSLQLSHISNGGPFGYTIAGQTQLTSEGLTINSSFSAYTSDNYHNYGGMHIAINGKSGISIGGNVNYDNAQYQPALSFYGAASLDNLLDNTIEPQYSADWDGKNAASGIWFDSYGDVHGYGSSEFWHIGSMSNKSHFSVPLRDGYTYDFALSSPDNYTLPGSGQSTNGQAGSNWLRLGLVHFYNVQTSSGYIGGYYPAFYSGSGSDLAGIAFGSGFVIIFGNRGQNNLWSFPQPSSDGHISNTGSIEEVTPNHASW